MLPVSAWPPGPPGASLSPFGKPRQICISDPNGFVLPKGAWIVQTTSNSVVMFFPPVENINPARSYGTGVLPGSIPPGPPAPKCGCPSSEFEPRFRPFNETVEAFRAWQRRTGNTDPPLRQFAGRRPPNWYGWRFVPAPSSTLIPNGAAGLVVADGQNVVITGTGSATITQAYSV